MFTFFVIMMFRHYRFGGKILISFILGLLLMNENACFLNQNRKFYVDICTIYTHMTFLCDRKSLIQFKND